MSAMVDRRLSTLNPNAPVFDPVGFREVEDFSPKWWDLVTTSKWFRDFWLSANSEYEFNDGDDFSVMEEEFEEMIASSDGGSTVDSVTGNEYNHIYTHLVKFMDLNFRSGEKSLMEMIASSDGGSTVDTVTESDVAKYLKMLLDMAESSKEKLYRSKVKMSSCAPKYNQKKMYMNPNFNCRRNHHIYQPR